jgi:1-deoxy-D-xylulose-5-phosphate reductoisomerase
MTPQGLCILGSSGTIGLNTLDVVRRHQERFRIVSLTANTQVDVLLEQCLAWRPRYAVMSDSCAAEQLEKQVRSHGLDTVVLAGIDGQCRAATLEEVDAVMAGIVGAAGLLPTLEAVRAGKRVMIANKEPLVMMGKVFVEEANRSGATLLPIDSEHNAIFQCLPDRLQQQGAVPGQDSLRRLGISRILLTGSGGPFLRLDIDAFAGVTPEQACAHPNWVMGRKISVDSATMMNKGLELIEACALFGTDPDHVEIVVHPQSIIHSMVEYDDGSILAQLGNPDMRTPIAHALAWPERIESGVEKLNVLSMAALQFEAPDRTRFPALRLARHAAEQGGTLPTVLNAANEVAVAAFLDEHLAFDRIPRVVEQTMQAIEYTDAQDLDTVLAADAAAREQALQCIN